MLVCLILPANKILMSYQDTQELPLGDLLSPISERTLWLQFKDTGSDPFTDTILNLVYQNLKEKEHTLLDARPSANSHLVGKDIYLVI